MTAIDLIRLHRVDMPLVRPFRTSFGTQTARDVLLVEVVSDGVSGWAECVAMEWPGYSAEYVDGAVDVLYRTPEFPPLPPTAPSIPRESTGSCADFQGHPNGEGCPRDRCARCLAAPA